MSQYVTVARDGNVAIVTIDNPPVNAMSFHVRAPLKDILLELRDDATVEAMVLACAGRTFVAGADISELTAQTPIVAKGRARAGQDVFRRIETCPKPIIAVVNGFALGGGCELAMACHIRIASDAAKFGQPESKLGLLPGFGGSQRLARLVGKGRAMQLLMTGEMIDAAEAYRIGLVNKVVPAGELMGAAHEMMKAILANAPLAVALCIEAVDRGLEMSLDEGLILEANHFAILAATDDMREGTKAFLEKRTPAFRGK